MKYQKKKISYSHIDDILKRETELRNNARDKVSKFEAEQAISFKKKMCALLIITTVVYISLYFVSKYSDGFDLIFPIASTLLIAVSIGISYALTSSYLKELAEYESKIIKRCERKVIMNYVNGFYGKNIYMLLHIPDDIMFDDSDLPKSSTRDFIRYVSASGKCFHKKYGCSNATLPIHMFKLASLPHNMMFRGCSICATSDFYTGVPEWYDYYLKLKAIDKQYKLKIDYSPIDLRNVK